jgi:hypothetical protein
MASEGKQPAGPPGRRRAEQAARANCMRTGISVPECSCPRCIEQLIRRHSPDLLGGAPVRRAA